MDGVINSNLAKPLLTMDLVNNASTQHNDIKVWFKAARVQDFPENGGACVKYKDLQVAVFNFSRRNEWYAWSEYVSPQNANGVVAWHDWISARRAQDRMPFSQKNFFP